jgi:hypothetical protein
VTLEEQLQYADLKAEQAYRRSLRSFKDRKAEIIAAVREGIIQGHPDYGDSGWHKTHAELHREELMEFRDAVAYKLMKMHQGWPT